MEWFQGGQSLVKDMDLLGIRAYREKVEKIAGEARAHVSACDYAEKELLRQGKTNGATGFQRNVNVDESINPETVRNVINKRKARMSATERQQAGMAKLYMDAGMSEADANRLAAEQMSAGKILSRLNEKAGNESAKDIILGNETRSPLSQSDGFTIAKPSVEVSEADTKPSVQESSKKPFVNPFTKK
jgi:hypothetical protein